MSPPSTICCAGCGYAADPDDPYPFRCPRAGTDDTDHVMTRVLRLPGSYLTFEVTHPTPPVVPPPCSQSSRLTFGSSSRHAKLEYRRDRI